MMTDITHAVTQSALEAFTRNYLNELGASIREDENRWHVGLPTHIDVDFSNHREFEIILDDEEGDGNESRNILTPESEFTQQLLDEATDNALVGQISLTESVIEGEYSYPSWIAKSNVTVEDAIFTPYYDRTAVCVFVKVGVETVSEYQTQFLEAVTIDVESETKLPGITDILIKEVFTPSSEPPREIVGADKQESIPADTLASVISTGQEASMEEVHQEVAEIRQSASRSAKSEFEEYRQLQEQRINDLQSEISAIGDRLENLVADVNDAESQQQRVNALEKRQELKQEKEELETRLDEVLQEKERGYAQKQGEIYDRHAIELTTTPIAITFVTYERGELDLTLSHRNQTASIRASYGIGAGVTDEVYCENCGERFSEQNPLRVTADGIGCRTCR